MAGKQPAVIVVLDSDSDEGEGGGGESRESKYDDGVTEIGASSSSLVGEMKVVPFVKKLYEMVEAKTESLVHWSWNGTSFIATNPHVFAAHVLPIYFKHHHLHKFTRQLYYYGFKKIKSEQWKYEYAHEYFQKGKLHLMKYIKPRTNSTTSTKEYCRMKVEIMNLKRKLQSLEEKLADVQASPDIDDVQVHGLRHSERSRHTPPWHGDYVKTANRPSRVTARTKQKLKLKGTK